MRKIRLLHLLIAPLLVLPLLNGCGGRAREAPPEETITVPDEYAALYRELDSKLGEIESDISRQWDGSKFGTKFSTELLAAESNRGEALLREQTLASVKRNLDALVSLGVGAVTLSINYPILDSQFPHSSQYLDFYRKVAAEIKSRGLAMIVETTTIFPNPDFSSLNVNYAGLTLERYKQGKRAMDQTILEELKPDYLTVENESSTQRANTGLDFSVKNQTEIVQYILDGLNRGATRMGAGAGTWDNLAYFESLARNTSIDYLDMHIYPIGDAMVMDAATRIADLAGANKKGLTINEAWLYKIGSNESAGIPGAESKYFARDAYGFWSPLDEKFLTVMVKLSHYLRLEFMSPFWMIYFYAYADYDSATSKLDYPGLQRLVDTQAAPNILSGTLSPTGLAYRDLIAGNGI